MHTYACSAMEVTRYFFFSLMVVLCSAKLPMFSWDTLPVFFHSANESGLYSEESLRVIAKFQMVTIDKWQSFLDPGANDDDDMIRTMKMVKEMNPNIATYFYMSAYKHLKAFSKMYNELEQHPDWFLRDSDGTRVRNRLQNLYAFDLSKPEVRQWWVDNCLYYINTTNGDGCYCDSSQRVNVKFTPPLSPEKEEAWVNGVALLTKEAQEALGDDKLLIGKAAKQPYVEGAQIEFFHAVNDSIVELMLGAQVGKVMQAHVPITQNCRDDLTNYEAAFLIGAGEHSYFGCGRWNSTNDDNTPLMWRPEYDKPLGAPNGPATYKNGVWRREFSRGTTVEFDTSTNTGKIEWGA